jgi:hypothetical protein
VYIPPRRATAANFVPSELDAIEDQFKDADADVRVQSPAPELAFVYIPACNGTAANFVPSELDAIDSQIKVADADVLVQLLGGTGLTKTENDADDEYDGISTVTNLPLADTVGIPGVARVVIDDELLLLAPGPVAWTVNV